MPEKKKAKKKPENKKPTAKDRTLSRQLQKGKGLPSEIPESTDKSVVLAKSALFPIVGVGASAGGLEAFEQFFRNLYSGSGIAYILVSHLDPGHASMLTEILQRVTKMPVVEAEDQMKVNPNHVYVIPPNREMTIFHGVLQLGCVLSFVSLVEGLQSLL